MSNIEQAVHLSLKYLLLQKKGYISLHMFNKMVSMLCSDYDVDYRQVMNSLYDQADTIDFDNSSVSISVVKKEEENE